VHVKASRETCQQRDPQGLYAAGGDNIPGQSFPFDEPTDADLSIDTEQLSVQQGAAKVIELLRLRKVI